MSKFTRDDLQRAARGPDIVRPAKASRPDIVVIADVDANTYIVLDRKTKELLQVTTNADGTLTRRLMRTANTEL